MTRVVHKLFSVLIAMLWLPFVPAFAQQKAAPQPKTPPQPKASLTGVWTGPVTQVGSSKGYSLVLTVREAGGETDYPELNCGGKLTRVGSAGGYTFYLETITRNRLDRGGNCIDGTITIGPAGDKVAWGWVGTHQGETLVAYSTLRRR
jgi:hypothetical protein